MSDFFYGKTVELQFDPVEHAYVKVTRGETVLDTETTPVQGVTSVIKACIDKSYVLTAWASKMCAEKILRTMPTIADEENRIFIDTLPWPEFEQLVMEAKKAHKEILDDAGNLGKQAHKCLEDSINWAIEKTNGVVKELINEPSEPRALSCAQSGLDWMKRHGVRWVCTEKKVYSREFNYAGTLDGLCFSDSCSDPVCCAHPFKNERALVDFKSGNAIYTEYAYQTSAYVKAFLEEEKWAIGLCENPPIPRWIIRLGKEDGKFESILLPSETQEQDFNVFLLCLQLSQAHGMVEKRLAEEKKERTKRKRAVKAAAKEKNGTD